MEECKTRGLNKTWEEPESRNLNIKLLIVSVRPNKIIVGKFFLYVITLKIILRKKTIFYFFENIFSIFLLIKALFLFNRFMIMLKNSSKYRRQYKNRWLLRK